LNFPGTFRYIGSVEIAELRDLAMQAYAAAMGRLFASVTAL
jgi:hypothetical protein